LCSFPWLALAFSSLVFSWQFIINEFFSDLCNVSYIFLTPELLVSKLAKNTVIWNSVMRPSSLCVWLTPNTSCLLMFNLFKSHLQTRDHEHTSVVVSCQLSKLVQWCCVFTYILTEGFSPFRKCLEIDNDCFLSSIIIHHTWTSYILIICYIVSAVDALVLNNHQISDSWGC
jgi:hypothetical protein